MTMNNNNFSSIIQNFMMNEINSVINKYSSIEPKKLQYVEALISKSDGEFKEELLQDFDKALKLATEITVGEIRKIDTIKIQLNKDIIKYLSINGEEGLSFDDSPSSPFSVIYINI